MEGNFQNTRHDNEENETVSQIPAVNYDPSQKNFAII